MKRQATAVWKGNGKDGKGSLTSPSGVLDNTAYSFRTRFENEKGTNPEELIAAAHAGCFAMQLAFNIQGAGFTATELNTRAEVTLEDGSITSSKLFLDAKVPDMSEDKFAELVEHAEKNCPISKLLDTDISVDTTFSN
jgi:osmotically inducible protein OsmC